MSAFIVQDDTINGVLEYLWSTSLGNLHNAYTARRFLSEQQISDEAGLAALGAQMMALNVQAVDARYGNHDGFRAPDYQYKATKRPTIIQALKSLRCWLYQCSEGDVPEHPLYKQCDELSNRLAWDIVSALPEYEQARWDA